MAGHGLTLGGSGRAGPAFAVAGGTFPTKVGQPSDGDDLRRGKVATSGAVRLAPPLVEW